MKITYYKFPVDSLPKGYIYRTGDLWKLKGTNWYMRVNGKWRYTYTPRELGECFGDYRQYKLSEDNAMLELI